MFFAFKTLLNVKAGASRVHLSTFVDGIGNWQAAFGGNVSVVHGSAIYGTSLKLSGRTQAWHSPKLNIYNIIKNRGAGIYNITMKILADKIDPSSHYVRMIIRGNEENSFIEQYGNNFYCAVSPPIDVTPNKWCYLSGTIEVEAEDVQSSTGTFDLMIDVLDSVQGQNVYIDDVYIYKITSRYEDFEIYPTGRTLNSGQKQQIGVFGSANVTYKTSNEDIATVDSQGLVTAKNKGRASIEVKDTETGECLYLFINVANGWKSFENGEYYIKNNEFCKYVRNSNNSVKINSFNVADNYQKWRLEYFEGGYYQIKSVITNGLLTISQPGNADVNLTCATYNDSDTQRWYIEPLYDGTYKIWPKSAEDYNADFCMSLEYALVDTTNVKQTLFSDVSVNKWEIFTPDLKVWNANYKTGAYWQSVPTIYYENRIPSSSFYFESAEEYAVEAWSNALDIFLYDDDNETNADIKCYGVTRKEFDEKTSEKKDTTITGQTQYEFGTMFKMPCDNTTADIWVFEEAVIYIPNDGYGETRQNKIFAHELGHALGFIGHSENSTDIMYSDAQYGTELTQRDIEHVKQMFDRFTQK